MVAALLHAPSRRLRLALVAWVAFAVVATGSVRADPPACDSRQACETACVKKDQEACVRIEAFYLRLCNQEQVGPACTRLGLMYGEGGPLKRSMELWAKFVVKGCNLDDGYGCSEAGVACAQGLGGIPKNDVEAVAYYKKSCDLGFVVGCRNYGARLSLGLGVPRDASTARLVLSKACDAGDPRSCTHLGGLLEDEGEAPAALPVYEKACRLGDPQGCHNAQDGGSKVTGKVDWGVEKAQRGCDVGMQQDCWELARDYHFGRGVAVDLPKAYGIASRACSADWAPSCVQQAELLEDGEGIAADFTAAITLYQKACKLGDPDACLKAGNTVWKGKDSVRPRPAEAIDWYSRGCKQNNPTACRQLGNLLVTPDLRAPARDLKDAVAILDAACTAQVAPACAGLGSLYRSGRGVRKDVHKAEGFAQRACDLGDSESCPPAPASH